MKRIKKQKKKKPHKYTKEQNHRNISCRHVGKSRLKVQKESYLALYHFSLLH